jgi:small subunit ribosomal protein S14
MAGRLFISKQYPRRKLYEKKQLNNMVKKILINDAILPLGINYNYEIQGKKHSRSVFYTRCRFSGRAKANFNKFKMSRMMFKRYSEFGFLNGIKKASW